MIKIDKYNEKVLTITKEEREELMNAEIISIFVKSFNKDEKLFKSCGKIIKVVPGKNKIEE